MDDLSTAWKRLLVYWEKSGDYWDDTVRNEIERHYWLPLQAETKATLHEIEHLKQIITQARRSVK